MIKFKIIVMRIQDTSMIVLHLPQHKIMTMVTCNGITEIQSVRKLVVATYYHIQV